MQGEHPKKQTDKKKLVRTSGRLFSLLQLTLQQSVSLLFFYNFFFQIYLQDNSVFHCKILAEISEAGGTLCTSFV